MQWFSNLNVYHNHQVTDQAQIAGTHLHSFWFNSSGIGLRIFISNQFPSDADAAGPGPHFERQGSRGFACLTRVPSPHLAVLPCPWYLPSNILENLSLCQLLERPFPLYAAISKRHIFLPSKEQPTAIGKTTSNFFNNFFVSFCFEFICHYRHGSTHYGTKNTPSK